MSQQRKHKLEGDGDGARAAKQPRTDTTARRRPSFAMRPFHSFMPFWSPFDTELERTLDNFFDLPETSSGALTYGDGRTDGKMAPTEAGALVPSDQTGEWLTNMLRAPPMDV